MIAKSFMEAESFQDQIESIIKRAEGCDQSTVAKAGEWATRLELVIGKLKDMRKEAIAAYFTAVNVNRFGLYKDMK